MNDQISGFFAPTDDARIVLCANKVDAEKMAVKAKEGRYLADKYNCLFMETSQLTPRAGRYGCR